MKLMITLTSLKLAIITCATVWLVSTLKPSSTSAFVFFAVWLASPYVMMSAALVYLRQHNNLTFHWYLLAAIVSIGGILFLADSIFWHVDAQGAIAVLMTPILQAGALILLSPLVWWVSKNAPT